MLAVLVVVFCLAGDCVVEEVQTDVSVHACTMIAPQILARFERAWPQYRGYTIEAWRCESGRSA